MAKLGFLGLGIMGYPMARNLIRAGHDVALWSHNADKAKKLAADEKGKFCQTPQEVGAHAEAVFLCVGDTAMVKEVLLGPNGVAAGAKAGTAIGIFSTIGPTESRAIGSALAGTGIGFLDSPGTGSCAGGEGGSVTF